MKSKKFTMVLWIVQLILSVAMLAVVFRLDVLPTKFFLVFIAVLVILLGITALIHRRIDEGKKSRLVLNIFILLINIALLIGNYYVYTGNSALAKLTEGSNTQTHILNVRVLNDSEIETINELEGMTVEYSNQVVSEYNADYAQELLETVDFTTAEVDTFQELTEDLYDGSVDAIILDEAYEGFMEQLHPDYQNETRVIATKSYEEELETEDVVVDKNSDSFSVFISGIDTYGSINTVSRSDVNLIMTVNKETHEILLTSIPRDYYVTLHTYGVRDKFTHSGVYGINETITTAEDLLDIDIDYYVRVNFTSLVDIVDALGGITINNQIPFTNRGYTFPVGNINMDGAQALVYARERYAYTDGDNQRIKNQQAILTAAINKAVSPAILTNYSSILSVVLDACQTNVPTDVITSLVKNQLNQNSSWNIEHQYLTGSGSHSRTTYSMPGYNLYVMEPNQSSVDAASSNINLVEEGETPNL